MELFKRLDAIGFPRVNLLNREAFIKNMQFMHALMVASEPLMQNAIDQTQEPWLLDYYKSHVEEERGHADWLENDLKHMGVKPETSMIAAACAGAQYYLIRHVHPIALLGYMTILECYPMNLEAVAALETEYGIEAIRTLRYHAEHDVDHRQDLLKMLAEVPEEHKRLVADNAVQTLNLLHVALR